VIPKINAVIIMDREIITQNNYVKRKNEIDALYVLHNYVLSSVAFAIVWIKFFLISKLVN
jgi:hypothetical protein